MINPWLVAFFFPKKQAIEKGYFPVNWEKVPRAIENLDLVASWYTTKACEGGNVPYVY